MTRWFRFYDDAINDPKVQLLPGEKFKAWVNLLCVASKHDGILPPLRGIAYALRITEAKASSLLNEFCACGLIDPVEVPNSPMSYEPHNWEERQYKAEGRGKDSYVYFIGAAWGSVLKIGFSKNPWARLGDLQTSHHEKLSVLATFRCKSHSEVDLHDVLKAYRKNGEWFDLPANIKKLVETSSSRKDTYEQLVALLRSSDDGELRSNDVVGHRSATTDTDTEQIQKQKDAAIAAPEIVPSAEADYFRRVKEICGKTSGGLARQLLTAKQGSVPLARAAAEHASTKQDPREYIGKIIRSRDSPEARGDAW